WTDGRYYLQAKQELADSEFVLYKMEPEVPSLEQYLSSHVKKGERIGVNGSILSQSMGERLEKICKSEITLLSHYDLIGELWADRPLLKHEPIYLLDTTIAGESRRDKIGQIRKSFNTKDSALFLSDLDSIMWLFNMRGHDIIYHPVALSYALLTRKTVALFVSLKAVKKEDKELLIQDGIDLYEYDTVEDELPHLLKNEEVKTVYVDPLQTCFRLYSLLKQTQEVAFVSNYQLIPKQIKNQTEIEQIKRAHLLDGVAVTKLIYRLKQTMKEKKDLTELAVSQELEAIRTKIPEYLEPSFETISAYGEHAAIVHYTPSVLHDKIIQKKGFLLIDAGGQYRYATTDMTRTIAMGELKEEDKKHYTLVLKGNLQLSHAVFIHGCTGTNLDILARTPIWKAFLDYRHGTGHGIGCYLCVHEGPQAFRWKRSPHLPDVVIEPNMVTSDEPGIYIENSHGIRLENALLCVEKQQNEWGRYLGFEDLTLIPFDLDAICKEELSEEEIKWLNQYHKVVRNMLCPFLTDKEQEWLCGATREI
ncbi:MAG: aminopeptidase P family protein, partial [Clostridia bacterium]|nr:aminopeptidase P family protein [Clostridia bacterium]